MAISVCGGQVICTMTKLWMHEYDNPQWYWSRKYFTEHENISQVDGNKQILREGLGLFTKPDACNLWLSSSNPSQQKRPALNAKTQRTCSHALWTIMSAVSAARLASSVLMDDRYKSLSIYWLTILSRKPQQSVKEILNGNGSSRLNERDSVDCVESQ